MRFPVMHRRMRNGRSGTRSTARSTSSTYTPTDSLVADAGSNQTVLVNETVSFDGSGSRAPDGGSLSYSWAFGTGSNPSTGTGEMPSCTYSTPGTKVVTLTVTDAAGVDSE